MNDDDNFYRPPTAPIKSFAEGKDYLFIKPRFLEVPIVGPLLGFTGLRFHPAPVVKVLLTWRQRWAALNRFEWMQFWRGVRLEVHICTPPQDTGDPRKCAYYGDLVVSKYAPGGEVEP